MDSELGVERVLRLYSDNMYPERRQHSTGPASRISKYYLVAWPDARYRFEGRIRGLVLGMGLILVERWRYSIYVWPSVDNELVRYEGNLILASYLDLRGGQKNLVGSAQHCFEKSSTLLRVLSMTFLPRSSHSP